MGTDMKDESQEVACTVPSDFEPDEGTLAILYGPPDEEGEV